MLLALLASQPANSLSALVAGASWALQSTSGTAIPAFSRPSASSATRPVAAVAAARPAVAAASGRAEAASVSLA
jgi:hypothetical protein